jgi:hypothetical protein
MVEDKAKLAIAIAYFVAPIDLIRSSLQVRWDLQTMCCCSLCPELHY